MSPNVENGQGRPAETGEVKLCTKCKQRPRADQSEDATNRHCTSCRTEATRAYRAAQMEQENGKGFGKGVQAMRELLAGEFHNQASGMFSGYEIATLIRQAVGPLPRESKEGE